MTSRFLDIRVTTLRWGVAVVILTATLSCDSVGPEPKPVPVPGVPGVPGVPATPNAPAAPNVPEVPEAPMVPITPGQIVFLDPWEGGIFVADANGRRLQRLTQSSGAAKPAVSPDGKSIAFSKPCDPEGLCSRIYTMTVNGMGPVLLQTGEALWSSDPAWSPDGKRIAFVQSSTQPHSGVNIYTINSDGTGVTQLTHGGYNEGPAWSPDGKRIVFVSSELDSTGSHYRIFEMDPDGSNVRRLTSGVLDRRPTWSPDGSLIAFVGLILEDHSMILNVMNANGSDVRVVMSRMENDERPAWSPDGKSITFTVSAPVRMCEVGWDFETAPCGQSAKRIGLDGVVDPTWELPSASNLVWQR